MICYAGTQSCVNFVTDLETQTRIAALCIIIHFDIHVGVWGVPDNLAAMRVCISCLFAQRTQRTQECISARWTILRGPVHTEIRAKNNVFYNDT